MLNVMANKGRAFLAAVGLVVLMAAACGDAGFEPITRPGNTLTITVVDMERVPQLRYTTQSPDRDLNHFRYAPTRAGSEVVALRVRVINNKAIKTIVTFDQEAALLEDFFGGVYVPVDIGASGELWTRLDVDWGFISNEIADDELREKCKKVWDETGAVWGWMSNEITVCNYGENVDVRNPPGWGDGPVRSIQVQGGKAKAGEGFLTGSIEIEQGKSIDGWMVFEAPEGTEFQELRWRAVDSILIPF